MFDFLKKKLKDTKEKIRKSAKEKEVKEESKSVQEIQQKEEVQKVQETRKEDKKQIEKKSSKKEEPKTEIKEATPKEDKSKKESKSSFTKTLKRTFSTKLELTEEDIDPILEELQIGLLESDVAFDVTDKICNDLKSGLTGSEVSKKEIDNLIEKELRKSIKSLFDETEEINLIDKIEEFKSKNEPLVITFIGTNGSGKTTTLAKISEYLKSKGYSSVLAAGDTFRAASIEQLEEHGRRIGVPVIKHKYGADSAAVIYDSIQHAKSKGIDVVLADTAGRSHTNTNLMDELSKVIRVNKPHLKILVIDSLTGNEAVEQAVDFNKSVEIDGVILTKMDVNPKGGAALSVSYILKRPILFIGLGQEYSDMKPFNPDEFIDKLFE